MIECEICLDNYLEGNLEQHQETCVLRLVFRCSICNKDYVSREGLWNHLDLHEIPDDSKELSYRELKANYKLHQCALCNNQRAYSKSSYEIHISKFHDNYEARNRTKNSEFSSLLQAPESVKLEHMTSADEHLTQSREVPTNEANNRKGEESPVDLNVNEDNNSSNNPKFSNESKSRSYECDGCGKAFVYKYLVLRHKKRNICHVQLKNPCFICGKVLFNRKKDNEAHFEKCKQKMWLCNLCGRTFMTLKPATTHNEYYHPKNGSLETLQLIPREGLRRDITSEKPAVSASNSRVQAFDDSRSNAALMNEINANASKDNQDALSGTSERRVAAKRPPLLLYCKVCDITFFTRKQIIYHRVVKHTEAKFQCSYCSKKFHINERFKAHEASCGKRKLSCEMCGKRFNNLSRFKDHIKNHLNVTIEGGDSTGGQNISKQIDTTQRMNTCIMCRKMFDSADELMKHTLTCLKPFDGPGDFRVDEVKLEIKVEEANLQDEEFQNSNEYSARSVATSLHSGGSKEMHTRAKAVAGIDNKIEVQRVLLENDEGISAKHQNAAESSECKIEQGVICLICGQSFSTSKRMRYHKTVSHTDPRYECSLCHKRFHFSVHQRNHEKGCLELRCHKCDITFTTRKQLDKHNIKQHSNVDEDSSETRKKEPPVRNELGDLIWPCSICGLTFKRRSMRRYHRLVSHTEPQHKCIFCQKMFYVEADLRRHVNRCSAKRCHECGIKFTSHALLNMHNINRVYSD